MLDFTIYSYGYSEIIYHTLQAIAMFRNSDFYTTIITTVALIAGVIYALQMVAARAEGEWRGSLRRVIGMMIFIQVLLLPTTTMSIKDHVEKHYWRVDNIPLAFALPIGMVETFGHILTAGFEQVFSLVDGASAHSYYHYGTVFGARLQKEVLQAKVRDPEFISNMSNFIERCVILPSMIGKQFTKEELVATEDMWGLIASRAGTFTRTPMTKGGLRVDPHPTCKDAVPYFEKKFDDAIGVNITSLAWKFKGAGKDGKYNPASRALNQNIKAQIGALYGNDTSVDKLLKHNMMINAVHSYRSGKYASAKAQAHNEAGGIISGDLAEKTLTGSLAVMKVIVYGSYIFLFPILILSGGIARYKSWITASLSLALWPSLFSMLNMIIDFAYQPASIVSYSTWSTELKKFDSIASTAANLTLMIPFLSFWITRMGEGGFMHLAGSIMATANSASASLAGEKSSGNRAWDNETIGNKSGNNTSINKHDTSQQHVSGSARTTGGDGTTEMVTAGGKVLHFGGAGQSSSTGESSYRTIAGMTANHEEAVRHEVQVMAGEQASFTKSQEKLFSQGADAMLTVMESAKTDEGYNIDTSTDEGREIVKHLNEVDRINSTNEYSWKQNAESYLRGDYTLGGTAAKAFGMDAGFGGKISADNNSSQSDSNSNDISSELGTNNKRSNTERLNKTESILQSHGVDKNTQNSLRENYQETKRLDNSISAHKDNIDSHNRTMNYAHSNSSEFSKDQYQDVVDAYQEKYGGSARQAHEAVSAGTAKARAVHKELNAKNYQDTFNQIKAKGNKIASSNNVDEFVTSNKIDSSIGSRRDEFAKSNNIRTDGAEVEKEIGNKGEKIKVKHQEKYSDNADEYQKTEKAATEKQTERKEQIDQYEEDRIGNGEISTLQNKADGLGRPSDKSAAQNVKSLNLETGEVEPLSRKVRHASKLESLKTTETARPVDKKALNNAEPVEPEEPLVIRGSKTKGKADGQYVDPKVK